MQIKILGKVAGLEEPCGLPTGLIAHGHDAKAHHIALRGANRLEEVGDRKPPALRLARECDAFQLALRIFGIEDDQVVAVAGAGIEADD